MEPRAPDLSPGVLERLTRVRAFFGHQSVGGNIVAGMEDLLRQSNPSALAIRETANPGDLPEGARFGHAKVGENRKPGSKIEEFSRIMGNGMAARVDTAFFKFCYADLTARDDPEALFAEYRTAMERLRERFPATRFVHLTVPVRVVQTGPRAWVKKFLGRPLGGYADNVARNRYNTLLRESYAGKEPLFDLARLESTAPGGDRCTFEDGGLVHEALCPEYTSDGGHLNADGRRVIAVELLTYLASLPPAGR